MDFKRLHYFITVADEGSISAAAKKLFMSQPPLSLQMKLLEEDMGCCLFTRGARSIQLTEAGRVLYDRAKNLLEMDRVIREDVLSHAEAAGGTVRVGIVSSLVCTQAAEWVCAYAKKHPDVRFEITETDTYGLLEKLKDQIIQMAIVRSPFPAVKMNCRRLYTDSMAAVCARQDGRGPVPVSLSLEELSRRPLIVYRRWEKIVRKWFTDKGLPFSCVCLNDDAQTTVHLTELGMGTGIVPRRAVLGNERLHIFRIEGEGTDSDVDLVYPRLESLPAYARRFIEDILERYPK